MRRGVVTPQSDPAGLTTAGQRKRERQRRALAWSAPGRDLSAVGLHQVLDDGQPQTRAAELSGASDVHPVEALGEVRDVFGRDAFAGGVVTGVRDGDGERLADCEIWLDTGDGRRCVVGTATVAITGATGHVGSNLVRRLVARGDTVRLSGPDDAVIARAKCCAAFAGRATGRP